jgi:hypothetical protein
VSLGKARFRPLAPFAGRDLQQPLYVDPAVRFAQIPVMSGRRYELVKSAESVRDEKARMICPERSRSEANRLDQRCR